MAENTMGLPVVFILALRVQDVRALPRAEDRTLVVFWARRCRRPALSIWSTAHWANLDAAPVIPAVIHGPPGDQAV